MLNARIVFRFAGLIPPELGNLAALQSLALENNRLGGEFPMLTTSQREVLVYLLSGGAIQLSLGHVLEHGVAGSDPVAFLQRGLLARCCVLEKLPANSDGS